MFDIILAHNNFRLVSIKSGLRERNNAAPRV